MQRVALGVGQHKRVTHTLTVDPVDEGYNEAAFVFFDQCKGLGRQWVWRVAPWWGRGFLGN